MIHLREIDIQKYIDRDVTPADESFIIEHISICEDCQKKLQQYHKIYEALSQTFDRSLSTDFTDQLLANMTFREENKWYKRNIETILLILTVLVGVGSSVYFLGIQPIFQFWQNLTVYTQHIPNNTSKFFDIISNETTIIKHLLTALGIITSVKIFDTFLLFKRKKVSPY